MKDFNEFVRSLDRETIVEIVADANQKAENSRESIGNSRNSLGNQIGAISLTIALELLGCCHKWVSQQRGLLLHKGS